MELSLSHTLHLFNIFREYDGKDNCAQVLEEEIYKMFSMDYAIRSGKSLILGVPKAPQGNIQGQPRA